MYIYLYLNIFTIFFPLLLSFDTRVQFYKKWKFLFPAIFVTACFFVIWDHYFTEAGIWGFNAAYLTGIYLFSLPLEEWLFFLTVPYACTFIYETLNTYWPRAVYFNKPSFLVSLILIAVLSVIAVLNLSKVYTSITFILLAIVLTGHLITRKMFLGRFYRAYLVHLLPFLMINGVLTYLPIVWYNNDYNLGLRIVSIPVEDTMYSMLLLLSTISIFEALQKRNQAKQFINKTVTPINEGEPAHTN